VDEGTKLDQSNKGGDRISQRGGGKKKVSKYDEWDEEEKAARAMLLGLGAKGKEGKTKGKAKAKDKEKEKEKEKGKEKRESSGNNKGNSVKGSEKGGSKPSQEIGKNKDKEKPIENGRDHVNGVPKSDIDNVTTEPSDESTKAKHPKGDQSEDPEVQKMLEEEENVEEVQKANEKQTNIDILTGQPHVGDVLLHAVPVIAPYSAMLNYKFKIKITPGHTKRGKAAKAAAEGLFRNGTQREKELMKAVPLEDLARSMVANVKLHATLAARKVAKEKHGKDLDFDIIHEETEGVK